MNNYAFEEERKYDEVLTVEDLMDYLALSRTTIYKLLKNGSIKSRKIGTIYRITKQAARDFMNGK